MQSRRISGLLALGLALLVVTEMRWSIGALAWIAPVPLLAALRARPGWRFRVLFSVLYAVGWCIAGAKIVTAPIPPIIAVGYGIPLALVHLPAYALWDRLVARGRDGLAIVGFASLSSLAEWVQAEHSPFGVWGTAPTTQAGNLAVLQSLALFGMPGLSFLIHAFAATTEAAWVGASAARARRWLGALGAATAALVAWGALRAERPIAGPEVRAATLRTDNTLAGLPIPSADERRPIDDALFARTEAAANAGAELVVWNEAASVVLPDEEVAYRARAASVARAHGIELVIAYILPLTTEPLKYENRLRWFAPDGTERLAYLKLHPVPMEPAVPGDGPAPRLETSFGPATGAVCYDYDFPALGRAHARDGVGVVALPSSDWRGIDPVHTEMAAMRAIEGGYSIVRSTRFGLSGGIDAHGRLRALSSSNESTQPFMMVSLPKEQLATPYALLGNLVLVPLLLGAAAALAGLRPTAGATTSRRRAESGTAAAPASIGS